jgi:hypothetical protein
MNQTPIRVRKNGSNAPVKLFLAVKNHGAQILMAVGQGSLSHRAIAAQFGLTQSLFIRALPIISRFEADIARAHFDGLERFLFEPVGLDYKRMPFYRRLLGETQPVSPRKKRAGQGRVPRPLAPTIAPKPATPSPVVPVDPFFAEASASSGLLANVRRAAAPGAPSPSP